MVMEIMREVIDGNYGIYIREIMGFQDEIFKNGTLQHG